jgi:hypothetical protein
LAQGQPLPGEKYLHFKNKLYQVITVAQHSETMERYVVYQALYGDFKTYIRPYDMFISEVDHEKYPDVTQTYRFQYVECLGSNTDDTHKKDELSKCAQKEEISKNQAHEHVTVESTQTEETNPSHDSELQKQEIESETESNPTIEKESESETINPWLDRFLDAEDMEEKYKIVCDMHADVTDRLIDDIAVVLDVVIPEGSISDRYAQLKYCIRTRQKYETTRFR